MQKKENEFALFNSSGKNHRILAKQILENFAKQQQGGEKVLKEGESASGPKKKEESSAFNEGDIVWINGERLYLGVRYYFNFIL